MELMRRQKEAVEVGEREVGDGIMRYRIEEWEEGASKAAAFDIFTMALSNPCLGSAVLADPAG